MSYSDLTFKDRNPIKRWLQRRRLVVAINQIPNAAKPQVILDFGAGNGELCKLLATHYPSARIICYEPTPHLMGEAKDNLRNFTQVEYCSDIGSIPHDSVDLIFCLEVFEHLPALEVDHAINQISSILRKDHLAIIGVPVETGIPALYKGLFRMTRRFGSFDATPENIWLAVMGSPPNTRPTKEIAPGFNFHPDHMGFDHRVLQKTLQYEFDLVLTTSSPFSVFGTVLNPEVYFIVRKTTQRCAL